MHRRYMNGSHGKHARNIVAAYLNMVNLRQERNGNVRRAAGDPQVVPGHLSIGWTSINTIREFGVQLVPRSYNVSSGASHTKLMRC